MPRSHALLANLFDYAGLFPPASLSCAEAAANYARYTAHRDGWMLGRFIAPAGRLAELSASAAALPTDAGGLSWRVSALVGSDTQADAAQVSVFNRAHADAASGAAIVDTVELAVATPEEVRAARVWASRGFEVYCEVSAGPSLDHMLDAIARAGLHAKLRTGGPTPSRVPSCDAVAAFLCGCVARGVVAKATAGLHHVLTGQHSLTDTADGATATLLGYLNLVVAAGVAEGAGRAAVQSREVQSTVARLLSLQTTPTWVGHAAVEWRGDHRPIVEGPLDQFAVAGRGLIRSIGTCSFEAPVADARRIGLIA